MRTVAAAISTIGGTYGKTVSLSDHIPTREGYDFTGWYSDQALTQKITELRMIGNRTDLRRVDKERSKRRGESIYGCVWK